MRRYGICPKCGAEMIPPKYDILADVLKYSCSCGYRWSERPKRRKPEVNPR